METTFLHCGNPSLSQLFTELSQLATKFEADPQLVVQYSGIIAGFISITVPIALDIISKQTEDFKDKEISELFLKKWLYKFQVYINLSIVFISILLLALGTKSGIGMLLIIVMDFAAIVTFIFFLRMVQQFATNFADYYSNILKSRSDEIVRGE